MPSQGVQWNSILSVPAIQTTCLGLEVRVEAGSVKGAETPTSKCGALFQLVVFHCVCESVLVGHRLRSSIWTWRVTLRIESLITSGSAGLGPALLKRHGQHCEQV